jgi:hypothetical protein
MIPITKEEERAAKMAALYPKTHGPECPDLYFAIAEWWRLHAERCAGPDECLVYAANQEAIARDMEARPDHHNRKPKDVTRFHWSQK